MNYWPAEVTALSECHEPLFDMLEDLSHTGAETARILYGAEGWTAHHNTDLWRICGPVDMAQFGMWPNGGAWLATHLWEHYLFTGDKAFLRRYYPVIKGTADFYLSYMVEHPESGYLVSVPSMSPEHGYGSSWNPDLLSFAMLQPLYLSALKSLLREVSRKDGLSLPVFLSWL